MKMITKVSSFLLLFIMVVSCATTQRAIPEKYNLDNELEKVDRIATFSIRSYENIDKQSLILETTYNDHYLLVLERPRFETPVGRTKFDHQGPSLIAGYDRVVMDYHSGPEYYVIEKIYKLKGNAQAAEIKKQLRKD